MTNTRPTQTLAPALPANAVTQAQGFRMLMDSGIYADEIVLAFHRLQNRLRTILTQGARTFHFERLGDDVYVITVA
jgi:hypothetical protein